MAIEKATGRIDREDQADSIADTDPNITPEKLCSEGLSRIQASLKEHDLPSVEQLTERLRNRHRQFPRPLEGAFQHVEREG